MAASEKSSSSSAKQGRNSGLSDQLIHELTQTFSQIDVDKDGLITAEELHKVMNQLGLECSADDVARMMKEADVDGNGTVDLEEFLEINAAAHRLEPHDSKEVLMDVFRVFDKNHDGLITAEELQGMLTNLQGEDEGPVSIEECRKMILGVDANGDGCVDFAEFERMMVSPRFHR